MTEQRTSDQQGVLDRLQERATGMQRPEELWRKPVSATFDMHETGKIEPMGFATRKEYEMTLTVGATFWANRAQVDDARKVARKSLARLLYSDVLAAISDVRHAIMDGDPQAAMGRLCELETRLSK